MKLMVVEAVGKVCKRNLKAKKHLKKQKHLIQLLRYEVKVAHCEYISAILDAPLSMRVSQGTS